MTSPKSIPERKPTPRSSRSSLLAVLTVAAIVVVAGTMVLRAAPGMTASIELKILGIALAVGLDVLALSIAIGITQVSLGSRLRLGFAFSAAEVVMQVVGYALGTGADHLIGTIADYAGFAVLAGVGVFIFRDSYTAEQSNFKIDSRWGLIAACASISLDSLGIGVSLPGVPLPLLSLLATVGVSTVLFTIVGLLFGARLGHRYKQLAERVASIVLIVLAVVFTMQHVLGWGV